MTPVLALSRGIIGKLLIVFTGYVLAVLLAGGAVALYLVAFRPGRQGSGGMVAFGDSVLYLWVLGMMAVPATAAALYFLRPCRLFWRFAALAAVTLSAVAVGDLAAALFPSQWDGSSPLGIWSMLAPVRILLAPLLGAGLFLAGVFAPGFRYRCTLLGATAIEVVMFVSVFFIWSRMTS